VKTHLFTIPNKGIVMCKSPRANTGNLLEEEIEENSIKWRQLESDKGKAHILSHLSSVLTFPCEFFPFSHYLSMSREVSFYFTVK
jgi:hypothetical protein